MGKETSFGDAFGGRRELLTHTCGHRSEQWIRGTLSRHGHEMQPCAKCRADEAREAGRRNHMRGLKPLAGTPKQAAWGEVIRDKKMKAIEEFIALQPKEQRIELYQQEKALRLRGHSQFWIRHRNALPEELLKLGASV